MTFLQSYNGSSLGNTEKAVSYTFGSNKIDRFFGFEQEQDQYKDTVVNVVSIFGDITLRNQVSFC